MAQACQVVLVDSAALAEIKSIMQAQLENVLNGKDPAEAVGFLLTDLNRAGFSIGRPLDVKGSDFLAAAVG